MSDWDVIRLTARAILWGIAFGLWQKDAWAGTWMGMVAIFLGALVIDHD